MELDLPLKILITGYAIFLLIIAVAAIQEIKKNPRFYSLIGCMFFFIALFIFKALRHQCANEIIFRWC